MKSHSKNTWKKIILVTFIASAMAAYLGFLGSHYIFENVLGKDRHRDDIVKSVGKMVKGLRDHSGMSYDEIEKIYNDGKEGNPFRIEILKRSATALDEELEIGEYKNLESNEDVRKSVYILDDESVLILNLNPPPFDHHHEMMPPPPPPIGAMGNHEPPFVKMAHEMKFGKENHDHPRNKTPHNLLIIPVTLTFLIMFIVLLIVAYALYTITNNYSKSAKIVLNELKKGNLKARLPDDSYNEISDIRIEFNEMANEIEKLVNNLRETDQMRKNLLQELAHDLRTPIASMKSLLETNLYHDEKLTAESRKENLSLALKENEYFYHLVEDLLFLSGVNDFKYKGKFTNVDISELIQHEVDIFETNKLDIQVNCRIDQDIKLTGDAHLLQRLFKNAISNAVSHASHQVTIFCEQNKDNLVILISDDGSGLEEDDLLSFGKKRFTRKVGSYQDGRISIGLGAVIMNKICEIHEGKLEIKNIFDHQGVKKGATLRIELKIYSF